MPTKFPQPYRGQPRPKYPKPRRQNRNLQKEKVADSFQNGLFLLLAIASLLLGIINSNKSNISIFIGIIAFIFFIILVQAASNGAENINKFRENYDIETSSWDEEDKSDPQE